MAERATRLNCKEKLEVELDNMTVERDRNRPVFADLVDEHADLSNSAKAAKQLSNAQMKKIRAGHARKLDALRDSFKARKSKLLQERYK